jgi:rubredoxin
VLALYFPSQTFLFSFQRKKRSPDRDDQGLWYDLLDLEDERQKRLVWHTYWSVPRSSEHFRQAEKELYMIFNLYVASMNWQQDWYDKRKQQLLDAGYRLSTIESVARPPDPISVLHVENGCNGELHQGLFKGQPKLYVGCRDNVDYKRYYCPKCGWIYGNQPHGSPIHYQNPPTPMSNLLQDLGVPTIFQV